MAVLEAARNGPKIYEIEDESEFGEVVHVSRFLIQANLPGGVAINEIVRVGAEQLIGEVIRLDGDLATIQLYDDPRGLTVGSEVVRTRRALAAQLAPGLLDHFFDGIQRPLMAEGEETKLFMSSGSDTPALDPKRLFEFQPVHFKEGDIITGGDVFGRVAETTLVVHWIMVPPLHHEGRIVFLAPPGSYSIHEEVLAVEFQGEIRRVTMCQEWAVRTPRPVAETLACDQPFVTGVRIVDSLFPLALGGSCVIPGAYGSGKGALTFCLAKYGNTDVSTFVGCGERGNELCELLMELPEISLPGRNESIMSRSSVIGNTSNMPMGSREASIYTGVTIAEYFRDQGYNSQLLADSTSRWAEALAEVQRTADSPASSLSPVDLSSRLSSFYARAGKVTCLGHPNRTGSLTIVGTVSPPGGDFSEPVTATTLAICKTFWALDKKLAQRKHFPSINWLHSSSQYTTVLNPYYDSIDSEFIDMRSKALQILQRESELLELIQIVGKDSLKDLDKLTLEVGKLLREDFLQQNMFTTYDRTSPHTKNSALLKNILAFHQYASLSISDHHIPFTKLLSSSKEVIFQLNRMKFETPLEGHAAFVANMDSLHTDIILHFTNLNCE